MLKTNIFYKWRFYFYLTFTGLITLSIGVLFIVKLLIDRGANILVGASLAMVLFLISYFCLLFVSRICNLEITLAGIEVRSRFYTWNVIEKIVFLANGLVYVKFKNGPEKISLLDYGYINFADFFQRYFFKSKCI